MTNTLVLEVPYSIYQLLLDVAKKNGLTPEQIALSWMRDGANASTEDPLLSLAGVIETDITDVAQNHDYYIGRELTLTHD